MWPCHLIDGLLDQVDPIVLFCFSPPAIELLHLMGACQACRFIRLNLLIRVDHSLDHVLFDPLLQHTKGPMFW